MARKSLALLNRRSVLETTLQQMGIDLQISEGHIGKKGIILLATLGERQTIRYVLEEVAESIRTLAASQHQLEVLIVDDSRDTEFNEHVAEVFGILGIRGRVIDGPHRGLGAAILHGFDAALQDRDVSYVVNLDADGQHDARQMPDLVRSHFVTKSLITIGSRWTNGGSAPGLSRKRNVLSRISAIMLHRVGVPTSIKDPTTSFRVYSRKALELSCREVIDFSGYAFFGGIIAVAASQGLKITEVPIHFRPRWAGESKMQLTRIAETAGQLWSISSRAEMLRRRRLIALKFGGSGHTDASGVIKDHDVMVCAEAKTAKHLVTHLGSYLTGDVLDVGAGSGSFSGHIAEVAHELTCIEPVESYFAELKQKVSDVSNCHLFHGTLQEFSQQPITAMGTKKYDAVFYAHVVEHIHSDVEELVRARQQLKQDGRAIVVVPSLPRLFGSVDSLSGHFRRFTRRELIAVANAAGFEVESIRYFNPLAILPYWLLYRVVGVKSVSSGQLGFYDRAIVPLAYKIINLFGGRIPGINLIAILKNPQ
jgi:2-polyprenyl-3-methyl-5-hydroxy-6-metoxy-1,4-benzoquinol methylase